MPKLESKPMTLRTSEEIRENFKRTYELSGATSQNEFLGKLLQKWNTPENVNISDIEVKPIETILNPSPEEIQELLKVSFEGSEAKTMDEFLDSLLQNWNKPQEETEPLQDPQNEARQLMDNEILLSLTPAQIYAIRETVLTEGFVENQNELIDLLDFKNPENHYHGQISEPEFQLLWVRNIILTDEMDQDQKEKAICHNMAAFLINKFLFQLIKGKLSETTKVTAKSLKTFIREHSGEKQCEFSVRLIEDQLSLKEIVLSLTPAQLYAIRETASIEGFAENKNAIIDSLIPENKPFFYFGNIFEPEFQLLWIRNIILTGEMDQDQKETAIRHNMSAFLFNMFLMHLLEGKISCTNVDCDSLKSFIKKQMEDSKPKPTLTVEPQKILS